MNIFFENYIELLYDYSSLYSTSEDMEAIALIFHSEKFTSSFQYISKVFIATLKSFKICRYVNVKTFIKGFFTLQKMSSAWITDIVKNEYIHLDLIVVQKNFRGKKYMSKIMNEILKEADERRICCTLETQNIKNINLYTHFGFKLIKNINLTNSDIIQYCMVYKKS
ncbi:GNAT family N-acetyltransferase [Clostridium sp. Marseille-Q7071]